MMIGFMIAGQNYMILNGPPHDKFNDAIFLSVTCEDQAEVDRYWNALTADGGRPVQCGWLKDKYGLSWQIVPRILPELLSHPTKGKQVMLAMMQMIKMDIAGLQRAFDQ